MSNDARPFSKALLRKFVAGELDEAQHEAVLAHLAEDDASLEIVDALWEEQASHTAVPKLPKLKPERASQIRRQLVHQIHRTTLTKNMIQMGTQGFSSVAGSLLRPLLSNNNHTRRHRRKGHKND